MKSAIHDQFGEPADVIETREIDRPTPGAGEVLVRMRLSPIHNHDLWTIRGNYGYKPDLPGAVGGSEAVGVVEAVGEGVDQAMIGQRVAIAGVHGAWAEFFVAPADQLLPLPDAVSDEIGAQLVAMPFSALSLLDRLNAGKDDWIVQTAANGAVGKIMGVLAPARGIKLLNLVRRDEAKEEITRLGMDNVLATSEPGWQDAAREILGDAGATSAIDSVGGPLAADLVNLLGKDGELVAFGSATGEPMQLPSGDLIMKHVTVKGFWGARVSSEMATDKRGQLIAELVGLAVKGELPLEVGGTFPLEEVRDAVKAALTPGRGGKILLRG